MTDIFSFPKAMKQDSSLPFFWDTRYEKGDTPWDAGGIPPRLAAFLRDEPPGRRVLIPGCGSGYEIAAFAKAGHDVTAIDFSSAAVERARRPLGPLAERVVFGDFFRADFAPDAFDLIYERTFLCALPRRLWPHYVRRMAALLESGGRLAGFFLFDDSEKGPPFGLKMGELEALLSARFHRTSDEPVPKQQSVTVLADKERWQIWKRNEIPTSDT